MPFTDTQQNSRLLYLPLLTLSIAFILMGLGLFLSPMNKEWMLVVNHLTPGWDMVWSFVTQFGEAGAALLLLLVFARFSKNGTALALKVYMLGSVLSPVLKSLFASPRPMSQFETGVLNTIGQTPSGANSMPSGHSMTAFAAATVLVVCFSLEEKKMRMALLGVLALMVGISRIMVGAHWPADVLAGAGLGMLVTWLAIQWEQRQPWQHHIEKKQAQQALLVTELVLTVYLFTASTATSAERLAFDLIATVGIAGALSRLKVIRQYA